MISREETAFFAIAILCGGLIAASNVGHVGAANPVLAYPYWLVRVLIEAALFFAFREGIEKFAPASARGHPSQPLAIAIAILASLFPFVLAITAFDIVLGYPELGLEDGGPVASSKLAEFGLELIYLFDNHVILCLLLSVPRFLMRSAADRGDVDRTPAAQAMATGNSFFDSLTPPLRGDLLWAEAQEHYVRLTTSNETRMVLHRFADVLRDIPADAGVRVHRSHWVAYRAGPEPFREGANLRLKLCTGDVVPVSRSYRKNVEAALAGRRENAVAVNELTAPTALE